MCNWTKICNNPIETWHEIQLRSTEENQVEQYFRCEPFLPVVTGVIALKQIFFVLVHCTPDCSDCVISTEEHKRSK